MARVTKRFLTSIREEWTEDELKQLHRTRETTDDETGNNNNNNNNK